MTPQERQLVDDLFTRLAGVENTPRDLDAAAAIADGLRRAPNALYTLVQTVLVQDEALKRAHDRIQQLEGGGADDQAASGGFLDQMRDSIFGKSPQRGSVPNVQPPPTPSEPAGLEHRTGVAADRTARTLRSGPPIKDLPASPMARRSRKRAAAVRSSERQQPPLRARWVADCC